MKLLKVLQDNLSTILILAIIGLAFVQRPPIIIANGPRRGPTIPESFDNSSSSNNQNEDKKDVVDKVVNKNKELLLELTNKGDIVAKPKSSPELDNQYPSCPFNNCDATCRRCKQCRAK